MNSNNNDNDINLNEAIEKNQEGELDPTQKKQFERKLKKLVEKRRKFGQFVFVSSDWFINEGGLPERRGPNKTAKRIRDEDGNKTKEPPFYEEFPNNGARMRMV